MGGVGHVEEGHPHPPPSAAAVHVLHVTVDLTNHHALSVCGIDPVLSGQCTLVAVKDLLARGGGEVGEVPQVVAVPFALAQLAVNVSQNFISNLVVDGLCIIRGPIQVRRTQSEKIGMEVGYSVLASRKFHPLCTHNCRAVK